ncbi:2OG-Fe(II) oxygenase [Silanimonas lenta]|uniref:2OG-Fe(II) oxygenase n=1 Tax=Silanimonas lenta TaxID=265429 RepID=UPI002FE03DEA
MMKLPEPVHDVRIGSGRVLAWDGLLPPERHAELHAALQEASYTRSEIARPDTADYRHWAAEIDLGVAAGLPVTGLALQAIAATFPGRRYRLYRCYVNVAHFGDMLFSHEDCLPGAGELTGLWYVCDRWDHEWGGETLFFDEAREVRAAIQPRPGRFALFNGEITHVGRPPNRACYLPRYTLAMKFEPLA